MIKVGKWIAKHKILIIIIGIALLIPSYLGMAATRINYDVLSYLPDTLETVDGQDIMVDQFGMGAFSMIVVEDMELKDVAALKEKIEAVDHVKKVLWYDSVLDVSVPVEMLPKDLREAFFNGDATMMIALFDNIHATHVLDGLQALFHRQLGDLAQLHQRAFVASDGDLHDRGGIGIRFRYRRWVAVTGKVALGTRYLITYIVRRRFHIHGQLKLYRDAAAALATHATQ